MTYEELKEKAKDMGLKDVEIFEFQDPLRFEEKRLVYRYPEHELEDTKIMPDLSKLTTTREEKNEEVVEIAEEEVKSKKINKVVIICSSIAAELLLTQPTIPPMFPVCPPTLRVPE